MNERIEELATQCRIEEYNSAGDLVEFGFDYEKFAELIVRECIQELKTNKKCDPYTGILFDCEYNECINDQITVLKEHFGIK